jgi:hypothetical protein
MLNRKRTGIELGHDRKFACAKNRVDVHRGDLHRNCDDSLWFTHRTFSVISRDTNSNDFFRRVGKEHLV